MNEFVKMVVIVNFYFVMMKRLSYSFKGVLVCKFGLEFRSFCFLDILDF